MSRFVDPFQTTTSQKGPELHPFGLHWSTAGEEEGEGDFFGGVTFCGKRVIREKMG